MAELAVGDQAPDFKVHTHTGAEVSLSDYRGKNVILWFYPKADTPGCTREGCGFRDRNQEFLDKGTQILGVSFDTVTENKDFAEKFSFPFPLLCDTERKIGLAYGACDDASAANAKRIAYTIDPEGKIKQAWGKVDATSFPEQAYNSL